MDILSFAKQIGKSKKILRAGWMRERISDPESVAEHSFRLVALAMIVAPHLKINQEKLMKMALFHGLGETATGDIVIERGNQKADSRLRQSKEIKERKGIERIFQSFPQSSEYLAIFDEMIERKSEEAKLLWQLDKLEMAIQALEYEQDQNKTLPEFFENAKLYIRNPFLLSVFNDILNKRPKIKT